MTREAVFECTYASGATRLTICVRAWDEDEAAERFTDALRDEGLPAGGHIRVRPRGDAPASPAAATSRVH